MKNNNIVAMELFPLPESLPDEFTGSEALVAIWKTMEAARGSVDEITRRTPSLTENERIDYGIITEQLSQSAIKFSDILKSGK